MTTLLAPPTPPRLRAESVTLGYGGPPVVESQSLDVPTGEVTAIVGANGCGKSTVLRGLARLLPVASGRVVLDGSDIASRSTKEVARTLALLPQSPLVPEGVTVADLVGRGRTPHRGLLTPWSRRDTEAVATALERTGCTQLADRPVDELSGGQRQRVWIAMVLAQQTDLLLLDEPTTYLDLAHQVDVLDLLAQLNSGLGTTVVMVLHDLNLAARYATHLVAMRGGEVVVAGSPEEVLTPARVREVFGLEARVVPDPVTRTPLVVPVGVVRGGQR